MNGFSWITHCVFHVYNKQSAHFKSTTWNKPQPGSKISKLSYFHGVSGFYFLMDHTV